MTIRLDKFLSNMGVATRTETAKAVRRGAVRINGEVCRVADYKLNPETDTVVFCDKAITYEKFRYIMLNKPEGYVSATEDGKDKTVLELLPPEYSRFNLFPCGRLDKYTVGLMLLTDNGELAHRLLSPKHHVKKTYRYVAKLPLSADDEALLEKGVTLDGGDITKPCEIERDGPLEESLSGTITLTEGKYHQIKRMFEVVGNKITYLERLTFGTLILDSSLERGEWRHLSKDEIAAIEDCGK